MVHITCDRCGRAQTRGDKTLTVAITPTVIMGDGHTAVTGEPVYKHFCVGDSKQVEGHRHICGELVEAFLESVSNGFPD